MKQILVEDNMCSVFIQIEVRYSVDVIPYRLIFDESTLRESSRFTLWRRNYPLGQLSVRRRNARFGWVNQGIRDNWIE
jgi:hypothetical protein